MILKTKRRPNFIYSMRRNRGYLQKHLATLLGQKGLTMISQYEAGASLPPLETALLLELALGVRLSELYAGLYQELQTTVLARAENLPAPLRQHLHGRLLGKDSNDHPRSHGGSA